MKFSPILTFFLANQASSFKLTVHSDFMALLEAIQHIRGQDTIITNTNLPFGPSFRGAVPQGRSRQGSNRNFENGFNDPNYNVTQMITDRTGDYGCWCYFATNQGYVGTGFGRTVDHIDAACKQLHDNYQCITHETVDGAGNSCDPWNAAYNQPNGAEWVAIDGTTDLDFLNSCLAANSGNECAAYTCAAENTFLSIWGTGFYSDDDKKHPAFDASTECVPANSVTNWSAPRGERECCGTYPAKKLFFNGNKGCCNQHTIYNSETKQCCSNGQVRPVGDQC